MCFSQNKARRAVESRTDSQRSLYKIVLFGDCLRAETTNSGPGLPAGFMFRLCGLTSAAVFGSFGVSKRGSELRCEGTAVMLSGSQLSESSGPSGSSCPGNGVRPPAGVST